MNKATSLGDLARSGHSFTFRSDEELVFGHEFCGEVLDHGLGSKKAVPRVPEQMSRMARHAPRVPGEARATARRAGDNFHALE